MMWDRTDPNQNRGYPKRGKKYNFLPPVDNIAIFDICSLVSAKTVLSVEINRRNLKEIGGGGERLGVVTEILDVEVRLKEE